MRVWRLSCHRPVALAFFRTFRQAVLNVVMGRDGSLGRGFPKGKTYHSGRVSPNFPPVPGGVFPQDREQRRIQRDRAPFPGFRLAVAHEQITLRELDLCPGKSPKFGISNACVQSQGECQVDMGRARLGCFSQHSLFLFCGVCLTDIVSHLELELFLFLQPHTHEIAKITHDPEQEFNLFIHSFGRCTLGGAVVLIFDERCLVHVNEHFVPNQALNVADCILREGCGLWKSQLVFFKELVCDLADSTDPFTPKVGEIVEAFFKFAATGLLRSLGQSLRFRLA